MVKLDKKTTRTLVCVIFAAIFFAWALQNGGTFLKGVKSAASLVFPLFLGFCIAFVLNVPMRFLERKLLPNCKNRAWNKARRPVCILISLAIIAAVVTLVLRLVVPELVKAVSVLVGAVQEFLPQAQTWASDNAGNYPQLKTWIDSLQIDWAETGKQLLSYVRDGATNLLSGTLSLLVQIVGGVTQAIIGFIFALYILADKEHLKGQMARLCRAALPARAAEDVFFVTKLTARTFASFVTGQCTEACILGTLCWLGMLIFRFPYAPMIGALVGIMALVPIVGAIVGLVVGVFMIMMESPVQALWFIVFLLCLQQIEGNLIYPRVVGSSVGLPALWVLAAVTVGGSLSGVVGMVFAVPTCSVLYALGRLAVNQRLREKGLVPADGADGAPPDGETPLQPGDGPEPASDPAQNNAGAVELPPPAERAPQDPPAEAAKPAGPFGLPWPWAGRQEK